MFPFGGQDDSAIRPLNDDDQRVLLGLVHRYGLNSLMCALTGLGESSRTSTLSGNTFLSGASAPSLVWTASDGASIRTQSTRGDMGQDVASIHDSEMGRVSDDRTWNESPCTLQSPCQGQDVTVTPASPRMPIPTLKKYQCPMCFLDHNLVEFGRKSDFKKHLNNFHGTDVVWICRTKGCHLSFATERAYSTHAKETHKMEAVPSSAARTELCPQLVFSCGFSKCRDRIFEAGSKDDASASRDKYFEHIAKHFEDDFDVNEWEYHVQIQNLMRQQRVKTIWKTCIWPKEKRQQLSWKPRSSGDLKRMLECRHLGEDISNLVRLAFILGTAPFTSSRTPPPSEIDLHFQLPLRSQCLLETPDGSPVKTESTNPMITISKSRPNTLFRLPSRKGKQIKTRPSSPVNTSPDTPMTGDDMTAGPHPGTPIPIPTESAIPDDAPRFVPDAHVPRQISTPVSMTPGNSTPMSATPINGSPAMYNMPLHQMEESHYSWCPPTSVPEGMPVTPYEAAMQMPQHENGYGDMAYGCTPVSQTSTVRPATPVPHKRPASFSRMTSMENMHPKKRYNSPHGSPYSGEVADRMSVVSIDTIPNAYGEMIPPPPQPHPHYQQAPTSVPTNEWQLPMRMVPEPHSGYEQHPQHHAYGQEAAMGAPMTFFFDDSEARI